MSYICQKCTPGPLPEGFSAAACKQHGPAASCTHCHALSGDQHYVGCLQHPAVPNEPPSGTTTNLLWWIRRRANESPPGTTFARYSLYAIAFLLACGPANLHANGWSAGGNVAWTMTSTTTNGQPATLVVDCHGDPSVRIFHKQLKNLPIQTDDPRPGLYGIVLLSNGWGLDLTRPDHHGMRSAWYPCTTSPGCLTARDTAFTIEMLKKNWTWFIRLEPPGNPATDIQFDLSGSKAAIDKACP